MRTTPKSTDVESVNVSPGAGVDEHTCQLRSMTWFRDAPVRSVEVLKNPGLPVSAWIASCAACKFCPRRSGIVHEVAAGTGAGCITGGDGVAEVTDTVLVCVSRRVTVVGDVADSDVHATTLRAAAAVATMATHRKIKGFPFVVAQRSGHGSLITADSTRRSANAR